MLGFLLDFVKVPEVSFLVAGFIFYLWYSSHTQARAVRRYRINGDTASV